jgi:hypothetical protein
MRSTVAVVRHEASCSLIAQTRYNESVAAALGTGMPRTIGTVLIPGGRIQMRSLLAIAATLSLLAALMLATGCTKKAEEPGVSVVGETVPKGGEAATKADVPDDTEESGDEETEEEKLARGREIMAQYEDATEPPVNWSWTPESNIDPASIPDEPVAGVCVGKLFIVKHAIIQEDTDDETGQKTWDLRFIDVDPEPGEEASMFGHDGRHIELTVSEVGKGVKIETAYGDSDAWDIDKQWFWYYTPKEDSPDGISMNPGNNVALYLEFTDWDETPPEGIEDAIGTAKGKIAVASKSGFDEDVDITWLAGNFEAIIAEPWGT